MKALATITLLLLASITFSQTGLEGTWLLPDNDKETPVAVDFKSNGEFVIVDVHESPDKAYSTIEGFYHFEENELVTITWEGDKVITSRYQYSFQNGSLILKKTYPNNVSFVFKRPRESVIQIDKI